MRLLTWLGIALFVVVLAVMIINFIWWVTHYSESVDIEQADYSATDLNV